MVGFYNDANGVTHGYEHHVWTRKFSTVVDPKAPTASLSAAAINDRGHVAGVYTNPATGNMDGFLLKNGQFTDLAVPGASTTMALGVNNFDEVVGVYTPSGTSALHGFTWTARHGFTTVDDPKGIGTTTINGVNDFGQLVGFYVTARATPTGSSPPPAVTDLLRENHWPPRLGPSRRGGQSHAPREPKGAGAVWG